MASQLASLLWVRFRPRLTERADHIGRYSVELLGDDRRFRVDASDNRREEECETLHLFAHEGRLHQVLSVGCCAPKHRAQNVPTLTVMLSSRKMKETARVLGLNMPRKSLGLSILSSTSVAPTFSDLTLAIARTFSSSLSHLAVSGRSVKVK